MKTTLFSSIDSEAAATKRKNNVASDRVGAQVGNSQVRCLATTYESFLGRGENRTRKTSSARRNCQELLAGGETIGRANHTISIASP